MDELRIGIEPELEARVRLAAVSAEGIVVQAGEALWRERIEPLCRELRLSYGAGTISRVPGVQHGRKLYRAIGLDPTSLRPSSEALLRRVLKGQELYRINSLVDTVNYCSLSFLLPVGLYDLERIAGRSVLLRRGRAGESYPGIRKGPVNLEGRYALFDAAGPFGSPTSDSERTSITAATTRALAVIFAPRELDQAALEGHAGFLAEQLKTFGGGLPRAGVVHLKC